MTTISPINTTFKTLSRTMDGWVRWLRFQRAVTWGVRGLLGGLALALLAGGIGIWQAQLLPMEFFALLLITLLLSPLISAAIAYLWPLEPLKAARYFDRVFHLNERVSTALELHHTKKLTQPEELVQKQLADAVRAAQNVRPQKDLPLRLKIRELLLALIFVVLLGLLWYQGDSFFAKAQQTRAVQQAAAEQAKKVEQILTNIQNNNGLTEEQKTELSAPLQQALNELKNNPSKEGAVSALTSAEEKMQALTNPEAQKMSQALQQAGSQAASQQGSPLQSTGQKLAQGNTAGAASDLANMDVSKLSPEQAQQLAGQLETMAQSLAGTNPQLAQQLQDAAQALKDGDTAKAQQALNQAAQSMAQAGQQTAQSQVAGQTAQQLQQGAGQVMAAGGGQQQGQTAQNGGQQNGQNGQQGQNGQMQGTGNGQGQGQGQGNGQSQGQGQNQGQGQGQGNGQGQSQGQGQGNGQSQGNGAGNGAGSGSYQQIYAPNLIGGNDGQNVPLPTTGQTGGDVVGTGPTTPGDPGASLVPYQQVYQQYNQLNHQAIENGQIPFEFLQAVRNYFDSLEP